MTELNTVHAQAMELAEEAYFARLHGAQGEFCSLSSKAFEREYCAAMIAVKTGVEEPTRSVLLRSAATLAVDCGELREAEKLISIALSADPPEEIANELRDLLEVVHFDHHLRSKGLKLFPGEFELSITGQDVSYGIVNSDSFITRIKHAEKMLQRTAERKAGRPFSESGRKPKDIQDIKIYLQVPRAASFAVSIRVGASDQLDLPGIGKPEDLIIEVIDCLQLFEDKKDGDLEKRIDDEKYFRNFLGLARQMAPDGKEIRMVAFRTIKGEKPDSVKITRTRDQVPESETKQPPKKFTQKPIEVTGELRFADATAQEKKL